MPLPLVSLLGLAVFTTMAWLMSSHRRRVAWRLVLGGVLLQFGLAYCILATSVGLGIFSFLGDLIRTLLTFVDAGSMFMFAAHAPKGETLPGPAPYPLLWTFAFSVLPTVIFFSSLMSVLYYLGLMQWVVRGMGWVMQRTLKTSGAESLAAAANVFVGHTEAPLVVRPYLEEMTLSELNAVMVGGFATISTGLLAVYADRGISPEHLIAASVISAPAALLVAKLMQPETGVPKTQGSLKLSLPRRGTNVVEAAAVGATEGLQLALNIGAMLIAFLAFIAMFDALLGWAGGQLGYVDAKGDPLWTLDRAFGLIFSPIAWLMGVAWSECGRCGELLGIKLAANEFLAYEQLGEWKRGANPLSVRSEVIMTYALAGFSNFGAIGIQIGGIGGLAPSRRSDLAKLGIRAMLGGALACCMTACVAGIVAPEEVFLKKNQNVERRPDEQVHRTNDSMRCAERHFSKKGNSLRISASVGCRPYSQISNASAYLTLAARSAPYHRSSAARYLTASRPARRSQPRRTKARRASGCDAGGAAAARSAFPKAPPSKTCDSNFVIARTFVSKTSSIDTAMSGTNG